MKNIFIKSILGLAIILQMACQSKNEKGLGVASNSKIVEANSRMSSAQLTDAAEQLLTPTQFMHADNILAMALEKDPENLKAQFYKSFLKSFMVQQGILTRIKPLVSKYGNIKEYQSSLDSIPNLHLKDFLLKGEQNISSVKDLQAWFFEYQLALNDFRKFLIVNQNATFTLELDPQSLQSTLKDPDSYKCETLTAAHGEYQFKCDISNIAKRTISSPDLIAIRQIVAGMVLYNNFYTAYSYEGIEMLQTVNFKENITLDKAEKFLSEQAPNFGKLRSENLLKEVKSIGSDFVNAARWVIQYQNEVCPQGINKPQQRKGFLFHEGLCVSNTKEALKDLAMLEQVLTKTMKVKLDVNQEEIEVDYMALFNNPAPSLFSLTPASYDNCGQALSFKDDTLNGLFPNKDASKILQVGHQACH